MSLELQWTFGDFSIKTLTFFNRYYFFKFCNFIFCYFTFSFVPSVIFIFISLFTLKEGRCYDIALL